MGRGKDLIPTWLLELSYKELKETVLGIRDQRDQALIATTYAAYGRIGEIVKGPHKGSKPMKKEDIKIVTRKGRKFLRLMLKTEKKKGTHLRQPVVSTDRERWLAKIIWAWRKKQQKHGYLFPGLKPNSAIATRTAELIFEKHFHEGIQSIHLLRKWRSTHALRGDFTKNNEKVPIKAVMAFGGWADSKILVEIYDQAVAEDSMDIL